MTHFDQYLISYTGGDREMGIAISVAVECQTYMYIAAVIDMLIPVCKCKVFVSSSSECRYGEIVNINLVRDKKTGKPKGFCFLAYENQRSTVLAVDNFNGIKV